MVPKEETTEEDEQEEEEEEKSKKGSDESSAGEMAHKVQIIAFRKTLLSISCALTLVYVALVYANSIQSGATNSRANRSGQTDVTPAANGAISEPCLRRAHELDRCLPKLVVYGDRSFEPPKNDEQLDRHCVQLDENLKCVSSYSRDCLPVFARNIYSVVTRRMKTQFAKRCKSKDGRRDFLNMMACADLEHMEPAHKCMDMFIAHLEHIGQGNQNRQIELTCCTFQLFQDCIFSLPKQSRCTQRKVSADKSIDYVKTIINSIGGDMMEFMCGRYESIGACRAGYPKQMDSFRQISAKVLNGTAKPKAGSPLLPMLQLFVDAQQNND